MLLPASKARKVLGVCAATLRRWDRLGQIKTSRTPGNQRLYDVSLVTSDCDRPEPSGEKIAYCRVSSRKQKDDLERQTELLKRERPDHRIVTDVGSGLNFRRPGLRSILESAMRGSVAEVVVAHRDRLCRFGFDLLEWIIEKNGGKLVVLDDKRASPQAEFVDDVVSVIHVFSCRLNGYRSYRKKRDEVDIARQSDTASDRIVARGNKRTRDKKEA